MKAKHAILAVVLVAGFAIGALAQGDKVTLVGTISDTSGAVLPGSEVVLTRTSTNEAITTLTTETGDFAFRGVVPDTYQIKASMAGFKSEVLVLGAYSDEHGVVLLRPDRDVEPGSAIG